MGLTPYQANDRKLEKETRANGLRAGSIISFAIESITGTSVFLKFEYQGFIFPALIALYATWNGRKAKITPHQPSGIVE